MAFLISCLWGVSPRGYCIGCCSISSTILGSYYVACLLKTVFQWDSMFFLFSFGLVTNFPPLFLKRFRLGFRWCFWNPSLSWNTIRQASLGLVWKFFRWHFWANSSCHLRLALLVSLRRICLDFFSISLVPADPLFMKFWRASFLLDIKSVNTVSDYVNQSGLEEMVCSATSFGDMLFKILE